MEPALEPIRVGFGWVLTPSPADPIARRRDSNEPSAPRTHVSRFKLATFFNDVTTTKDTTFTPRPQGRMDQRRADHREFVGVSTSIAS